MKAEIGMKVVTGAGFYYHELVVVSRTPDTIATKFLNGSSRDRRAKLAYFRVYDKAKVDRLLQLGQEIDEKKQEQSKLYQSLERIE